jgi:hypothetical protein
VIVVIGQVLVAQGALTAVQLADALAEQRRRASSGSPVRLGELLVEMRLISREELTRALAQRETAPA